ncbi:hypothetical protein SAMN02799622_05385 [Methylobacterium sp. UNC378MF]|uniref:hypothetical protein n=1 Tax=Methylobacterium sp. UNC378MF TaxID=1502748 RepID=UPI000886B9A7|nr:hypothetical protein [Methylobacterium sp. UNC378MF]SDA32938.1 hypothetical protein SAMN02799622_05385 [Methylobacterium sp. UNC378MF]
MRRMQSSRQAAAFLAAGLIVAFATPTRADAALVIRETRLHTPPDSHEPQRAMVNLRNTGPDLATNVTILCTFTGAGGAVLDTQQASVPEVVSLADVQAETIYYGWPRASSATCRLTDPH